MNHKGTEDTEERKDLMGFTSILAQLFSPGINVLVESPNPI
jgi:hypothetical protein